MQLEALLEYFHVTCKPAVADMDEKIRVSLLSNIDIVATGAVLACTDLRRKLTWCLLDNTLNFYKQIKSPFGQGEDGAAHGLPKRCGSQCSP